MRRNMWRSRHAIKKKSESRVHCIPRHPLLCQLLLRDHRLKKKKAGIFSKLSDLQTKKEKTSSHREATEIQSTQARNEYIMSLTAANAHLHHFYAMDLPELVKVLDDDALDKSRNFILTLIEKEMQSLSAASEGMTKANQLVETTSGLFTTYAFLADPSSACIRYVRS